MKPIVLLLCVWSYLIAPVSVAAQQVAPANDWARLLALTPPQELLLETKSGQRIKGKLASASNVSLTLTHRETTTEFTRDQIKRVYRLTGKTRGRSALKGLGIGAAIGLSAGLIFYLPARDDNEVLAVPALTVMGAGIGAGLGALIGKGQKRELIYSAE